MITSFFQNDLVATTHFERALRTKSSAGFQPAVSPISNRQTVRTPESLRLAGWKHCDTADWKSSLRCATVGGVLILIAGTMSGITARAGSAKTFSSPQELVSSLGQAVNTTNKAAFAVLFGPEGEWLANPDTVQGAQDLAEFTAAFNLTNHLARKSDTQMILEVGNDNWPFPVPIVKTADGWFFDSAAGREEVLNRRIGRNEIEALQAVRAYVDAQREYASRDRSGNGVLKYAQRIASSPGKTDGLYWPTELNGQVSPLGPMVAEAQSGGYFRKITDEPQPFHGYYFRILTQQGTHAPGGKYGYIINGNMIAGFALVAWPAEYGESGIMTFIVNQQGRVYQKDLGPKTEQVARKMTIYDPDPTWRVSKD
ncbi:MAG: DUF2950 domain-containing protein [Verrucomicrobia bacterium]|nr:MAG: DUF2950 domain-containing protein [Verrucomicrobiota bacterium]